MSSELIARLISSVIFLQGIAICTMEDEALSTLPTNEMLKELSVTGMINHTGIEYIVRTRQLRKLSLFLDRIDDRDIELIGQHQPLEELTIANSWVKDSGVVLLAKNTTLKALALSYNQITDEGVKSLSENTNLISLSLAHNKLTDSCVPYLTKMRSLVELNVSKNALTVSGVKMLYESGIREIDASSTMQKRMLTFSFDAMRQRTLHAGPDLDNPAQFGRVSGADLVAYYSEIRTRLGV
jgi:Leucine-rich repeat (LRR) protein